MRRTSCISALVLALLTHVGWTANSSPPHRERPDPTQISLEALRDVEVVTISKRPEKRTEVAAAVYIITQEDIRHAGVTSIPEALRLAPGVQVARIDANKWAVGVRGFASRLSRSLLVLIDDRNVYSPLFAGVYWENQDTLLADIDRIEVIRGSGGTIWGANAVNGVINIITKRAQETQGGLLSGGQIGQDFFYRVYGKAFNRDTGLYRNSSDFDDWRMGQLEFRTDWQVQTSDTLTLQGDLYGGQSGQRTVITTLAPPSATIVEEDADLAGGNLLGRWQHTFSTTSDLTLQIYYDRTHRREPTFREDRDTFDIDVQHRFRLPWQQEIIWGLGYRLTSGDTNTIPSIAFVPARRTNQIFSAFVQDEIALVAERLHFIIGSKFEHNDYSGFEVQPSGKVTWQ
jgi:iron complex outermembrane receptor protein